jgi:uncharacterized membrane protein YkoI
MISITRVIQTTFVIATLGGSFCLSVRAAEDKEEKVSLDKIPASAAKAIKEAVGGEKIQGLSKEKDEGKTVYEVSFHKGGRAHDVTVDESGKVVSDEEVIPVEEAPKNIREAIEKEHPGGKIEKLERITEGGKISYEVLISGKGKREEIKFDSKGGVVEREDKSGKKGKD